MDQKIELKVGTKDEAYWTDILRKAEEQVLSGKNNLIINEMIVGLAKDKIEEEKKS